MTNETDKWIEETSRNTHIKWLAKAKTAIIDGSEMTVLPYGYLQTAVKEVLLAHKAHLKEQMLKEIDGVKTMFEKETITGYDGIPFWICTKCGYMENDPESVHICEVHNSALQDMTAIINKI